MALTADRLRQGAAGASTGGYSIDNSCRFNDDDSAYLSRTPSSAGNRKTWTWSGWVKRGNLTGVNQNIFGCGLISGTYHYQRLYFADDDSLRYFYYPDTATCVMYSSQVFRDVSAWYHICFVWDTTQATEADRVKIYINGEQMISFASNPWGATRYPSQNTDGHINNTTYEHRVGRFVSGSSNDSLDGYLAEVNFVDGQALTPSDFGETGDYGEWKPTKYSGSYGTNGFYLDFKNSGSLGNDANGSNNWTTNNLSATDQMLDSPTNNFCTINSVYPASFWTETTGTISEGNTKFYSGDYYGGVQACTFGFETGKWYWEIYLNSKSNGVHGIVSSKVIHSAPEVTYWIYDATGNVTYTPYNSASGSTLSSGAYSASTGDILGFAVDMDNNTLKFYLNNTLFYTATSVVQDTYLPATGTAYLANHTVNFGQDSSFAGNKTAQGNTDSNSIGDFFYTPPTGFLALCTSNLPDVAVIPSEHFNTVLYTGNSSTQSITGVGFQPDFVWLKARNIGYANWNFDVLRGATKLIYSNYTNSESTDANSLTSFNSDGYSLGSQIRVNGSGNTYASWNWKANGTGVSNTSGSITSTVSANVDAGFSIVGYNGNEVGGATVGHGLSNPPEMVLIKQRTTGGHHWKSIMPLLGAGKALYLNLTNAAASGHFDNTLPTSSVFTLGTDTNCNESGADHIAYCFHSVDGYSKVGSYTGNGSTDGTFVYTGFAVSYVMIKITDDSSNWIVLDNKRDPYNQASKALYPDATYDEGAFYYMDFTSNGFKLRNTDIRSNSSAKNYIFLAFAEHPFKHTNAR
jgi:hypothetical protein